MILFHELPECAKRYRQPALVNAVGMIPLFLSEHDERPAREQFAQYYVGGWNPPDVGFKLAPALMIGERDIPALRYPGDPDLPPLAFAFLRNELIIVYPYAWVMILQPDGSHEISRMD